ncbi:MAG: glycosyltransferase [Acidimicrobiales bacterium]
MSRVTVLTASWSLLEDLSEEQAYVRAIAAVAARRHAVSVLTVGRGPTGRFPDGAFDVLGRPAPAGRPTAAALVEELVEAPPGGGRLGLLAHRRAGAMAHPESPAAVAELGQDPPDLLVVTRGAEATARAHLRVLAADRLPTLVYVPLLGEAGAGPGGLDAELLEAAAAVAVATAHEAAAVRRQPRGEGAALVVTGLPVRIRRPPAASRSIWLTEQPFFLVLVAWPPGRSPADADLAAELCAGLDDQASFLVAEADRIHVARRGGSWCPEHVPARSDVLRIMSEARAVVDLRRPALYEREVHEALALHTPVVVPASGYRRHVVERSDAGLWFAGADELVECVRLLLDEGISEALRAAARPEPSPGVFPGELEGVLDALCA